MQLDMEKGMEQARKRSGDQLYNQYMGGATTAGQYAIGAAQMETPLLKQRETVIQGELICCVNSLPGRIAIISGT